LSALQPDVVATGNPGCTLQIAASAAKAGCRWPVVHPIEILDASIRGLAPWGPSSAVRSRDVVADV
jgi:glycolate oxidase iron-sulfur subunit